MTSNRRLVLWHLRIYGPCSIAELVISTQLDRTKMLSAMRWLRDNDLAERQARARYIVTMKGREAIDAMACTLLEELR